MKIPTSQRFRDLTDKTFGRLRVVKYVGKRRNRTCWLCRCECGNTIEVLGSNITRGNTKSCGCFRVESSTAAATTHGQYGTRTYKAWARIKVRCYNPKSKDYSNYGGRGITICERWRVFDNFHADMGECPSPLHSIDRKNNAGNYEPVNCRWATMKEQTNNKRNNRLLTHDGITLTVSQWGSRLGIKYLTLHNRLQKGWSVERTLTTPPVMSKGYKTPCA